MYSRNKQKDKKPWAGFYNMNVVFTAVPSSIVATLYAAIYMAVGNAV